MGFQPNSSSTFKPGSVPVSEFVQVSVSVDAAQAQHTLSIILSILSFWEVTCDLKLFFGLVWIIRSSWATT